MPEENTTTTDLTTRIPTTYYGVSFLSLISILILEPSYSQNLFDYSVEEYIPDAQEKTSDFGFTLWQIYSNYVLAAAVAAPIVVTIV